MTAMITYTITPTDLAGHLFTVECHIPAPDKQGQIVSLPTWIPGSYMIRDFAKNLVTLTARNDQQTLRVVPLDKSRWQIEPSDYAVTLCYTVYAWDLSVRSAHLDQTHGFFNGTSVFLAVEGQTDQPCQVDIHPPASQTDWQLATTLKPVEPLTDQQVAHWQFGCFVADHYDELIDHPVEMGPLTLIEFMAAGIPHAVSLSGRHFADTEALKNDLAVVCEQQIQLFGEAPFERYLFMTYVTESGYGGLEHRSSTALVCGRRDLPSVVDTQRTDDYRKFLGLCSHEYFHSWNIKRIKPEVFVPYDLSRESYTEQLWAFEGITSYYDDLMLVRSGLLNQEQYLQILGELLTRIQRTPGRLQQTVTASSFDAWTKFYRQDENAPNAIVSYYAKGAVIALGLDLILRQLTDITLDDVMRALWQRYGKPVIGVPEQGIQQLVLSLVDEGPQAAIKQYFQTALYTTDELDLSELFTQVGVQLNQRAAQDRHDKGGTPGDTSSDESGVSSAIPDLGLRFSRSSIGIKIKQVLTGSAAHKAGISAGDIVLTIDRLQLSTQNYHFLIRQYSAGQSVTVHGLRHNLLMEWSLTLPEPALDTVYLQAIDDARLNAWLN